MKRQRGFTLIELLIVIAIIAILVAILVPVFFKVKESTRQGTAMVNMKLIGQGIAQYKLDNHHPPQVLFGYYVSGKTMDTFKPAPTTAAYPAGLYPAYVKTADTFKDPDNPSDTTTTVTVGANSYYAADAYDINPQVTGASSLSTGSSLLRYNPAWETPTTNPNYATDPNYPRQLQFSNPPGDTYVTCTTYHVPGADKVLVLFENGSVKQMTGADFAAQETGGSFWTVKP